MRTSVYVKHGVNKKLQQEFHCSEVTVRRALNGETDTELARRIRASAIQNHEGRSERVQRVIVKSI